MDKAQLIRQRLLEVFVTELDEQLAVAEDALEGYSHTVDADKLQAIAADLFRALHSLKGAARSIEQSAIESRCHELENLLAEIKQEQRHFTDDELRQVYEGINWLRQQGRELSGQRQHEQAEEPHPPPAPAESQAHEATEQEAPAGESSIRVATQKLAQLAKQIEELRFAVQSSFQVAHNADHVLDSYKSMTQERSLRVNHDLQELRKAALYHSRAIERKVAQLDHEFRLLRQQPFSVITRHIDNSIRTAAKKDQQIQLISHGKQLTIDRMLVNELRYIANHLVRNAIEHGIESSQERTRAGKPEQATITVRLELDQDMVRFSFADDGRGINTEQLKAKLKERSLNVPKTESELLHSMFAPDISTSAQVSKVAGRGVGLDAVNTIVKRLRGRIEVETQSQQGTTFTIQLPISLYTYQALIVEVDGTQYALDAHYIVASKSYDADAVVLSEQQAMIPFHERHVPCLQLREVLDLPLTTPKSVVFIATPVGHFGLLVDTIVGIEEVASRRTANALQQARPINGATLLKNGSIAYTLDATALNVNQFTWQEPQSIDASDGGEMAPIRVLVVEDSLTTRMLLTTTLEGEGFAVIDAANGEKAWQLLQEEQVDIVVSDIEMPALDGFKLTEKIRTEDSFGELPIILVTARESEEDKRRGLDAGASHYMRKSQFDQAELIEMIQQLVPR